MKIQQKINFLLAYEKYGRLQANNNNKLYFSQKATQTRYRYKSQIKHQVTYKQLRHSFLNNDLTFSSLFLRFEIIRFGLLSNLLNKPNETFRNTSRKL